MKDFDGWNLKKKRLDQQLSFQHPREREIWWCSIGINIGSEIYGKGNEYTRPVLVINSEGSESFIGIPLSSKIKYKKYSCPIRSYDGKSHTALVYQIRSFDKRRMIRKLGEISLEEYLLVKEYFNKIYKIK